LTSFTRIVVVLSLLRYRARHRDPRPPNSVIIALAVVF